MPVHNGDKDIVEVSDSDSKSTSSVAPVALSALTFPPLIFTLHSTPLRDGDDHAIEWVQMRPRAWHHLDELFAGACDGMTYEEIEELYPQEFEMRELDKLAYRYPRGESYLDVIARLEPIIMEMERHREPLLIVGHQGIVQRQVDPTSTFARPHVQ